MEEVKIKKLEGPEKDKGDVLIWLAIFLLIALSIINITKNKYITYIGLVVAIGMILYWFFKGRKI